MLTFLSILDKLLTLIQGWAIVKEQKDAQEQRNEIEKLKRDEKSLSQLVDRLARASQPKPQKSSPTNIHFIQFQLLSCTKNIHYNNSWSLRCLQYHH